MRVARLLPLWSDLEPTKTDILKLVQGNYFNEEIKILKDFQTQTESLDPYLDTSGLLRVGGQIKKTNLSDSLQKPVISPKTGHITEPVLHHAHEKTHHSGIGVTLNELRSNGYWIIKGNAAVRHFISRCVTC